MTRDAFRALVADALATIPERFRDAHAEHRHRRRGRAVARRCCAEMEIEPPDTLLGLYQGTPLTERQWGYGNALPDRITLFQGPIEDASRRRGRPRRRDRRDADPRDRPLLRPDAKKRSRRSKSATGGAAIRTREDGQDAVARLRPPTSRTEPTRCPRPAAQALRPALPRAGVGGEGRRRRSRRSRATCFSRSARARARSRGRSRRAGRRCSPSRSTATWPPTSRRARRRT